MQFHHQGYVSGDPRTRRPEGVGLLAPRELPDEVDVLIVGAGPAGMITAAQLAQFPHIRTHIVDRRGGRLEIGQADGIQARSVETFQAFGFASRLAEEAFHVTETCFWTRDPDNESRLIRSGRTPDDPRHHSEFPHLLVNQARVLDYFVETMAQSPSRMAPDYGYKFVDLTIAQEGEYPVTVQLVRTVGVLAGETRSVQAKYVVGADGAHSSVRSSIGCHMRGDQANHAWGVLDVLAVTDFPDIRKLSTIHSGSAGNILLIPREGGFLFRFYVDLGEVAQGDKTVRQTPVEAIIAKANKIVHPYSIDVKNVAWHSVYEVGHRLSDYFDNVRPNNGAGHPRVFIMGDACHTHSAKGGQGMNVSMQDGFNLGWKLGHVLDQRSPESLLNTYAAERRTVAEDLLDFDKAWSALMARKSDDLASPIEVEKFFLAAEEFRAGFRTQYEPSLVIAETTDQGRATGFPVGKRFASAMVARVADSNPIHLGHHATADGRWRIYVFADASLAGETSAVAQFADWFTTSPDSPAFHVPKHLGSDAWFDVKVVYQQDHRSVDISGVPDLFLPRVGPYAVIDYERVYAALPDNDIFANRGIDRDGAVVIVRPDQYVAAVLPLHKYEKITEFFRPLLSVTRAAG